MPVKDSSTGFCIFADDTSLTLTATQLSKAGAAASTVTVTMTEIGNNAYRITPLAAHRDTIGHNFWLFQLSNGTYWPFSEEVTAAKVTVEAIDDDTITASAIEDNAITAAKIASGAIDDDAVDGSAVTAIQNGLSTFDASTDEVTTDTASRTASQADVSGLATATALSSVATDVSAILVDTGTTLPATLTTIAGYIDTEVAAIKAVTDKLDTGLEDDGSSGYQWTTLALENGPSGGGGGGDATASNQTTIIGHLTDIKGSGWTTTDSLEAIRDRGDAEWTTATGFNTVTPLTAAGIRTAIGLASANLDTQLDDIADVKAVTDKIDTGLEDDGSSGYQFTTLALENGPGGGSVTVSDITQPALAKFATTDTGETTAADGSVAKIAQGSAGGNVTVGAFTSSALVEMVTTDTGETSASNGSVAKLAQADTSGITSGVIAGLNNTIVHSAPVATDGQITSPLVISDDYKAVNSRALTWTTSAITGATSGGSTCRLGFSHPSKGSFTVDGSISVNGDGDWVLSFDIDNTDSAALEPGEFDWSVEVIDDASNGITRVRNSSDCNKVEWVNRQT